MVIPSGVRFTPSGWKPTRVSLCPNRRSPSGAARFFIDVGEWVGEFSLKSIRIGTRQMLVEAPPPRRLLVLPQKAPGLPYKLVEPSTAKKIVRRDLFPRAARAVHRRLRR